MRSLQAFVVGWGLLLGLIATDTGYTGPKMDAMDWFPYQERYAIIVMGGNVAPGSQHYTWYWGDTYGMYQELELYGFSSLNVYFLSYGPSADEHPEAVDAVSTTDQVRAAYHWAGQVCTADDLLYIYWVDHGSTTSFQTNDGNITHVELGTLMQPIACKILGAYNPCFSGAVVDDVSRIGVISTTSQDASHANSWGWAGKWRQALSGGSGANPSDADGDGIVSMTEAYEWICPQSQAAGEYPLYDDNGDGVGHECDQSGFDPHDRTKDGYRGNFHSLDGRKLFPPLIETDDATDVGESTARLWGHVVDTGGPASCQVWFEYGETPGYGLSTVPRNATSGGFSDWIGDLDPDTLYHFRACGSNGAGADCGEDRLFVSGHPGVWWDARWPFRKTLAVDNPLNGYQMPLVIYRQDGHDSVGLGTVDCDGHCSPDFSDIRFLAGGQELAYWVETVGQNGADPYVRVWIRTNDADTLHLYYGNSYALTRSDGDDTFLFFDDFGVDSRMEYSLDSQTGLHCYTRSDCETGNRRIRFKNRLYSIQSAFGGGSTDFGSAAGSAAGEGNYVTIHVSYDTNSTASALQPGIQLVANDATDTSETPWVRATSAGQEYTYEIRLIAGESATAEISDLEGTTVWSDTLTENVPTTLGKQLIAHASADAVCSLEELTWMNDEKRLRSFNMGSDSGCDAWIENWIDWWFVAGYAQSEPSWASIGPEEQAGADHVGCCEQDPLGVCVESVPAEDCEGWIVHECCGDGNANAFEDGCESVTLRLSRDGLVWSDRFGAIGYDVVRGDLGLLLSLDGDFASAVEECLADDRAQTSLWHVLEPAPSTGSWYLVRGVGVTGNMTYAAALECDLGARDQEIDLAVAACP